MTAIDDSSAEYGGTGHLLLKVARRGLVLLAILSWVAWIIGGFGTLMIDPPLPRKLSLSLRIDAQGLLLQLGPAWRQKGPFVTFTKASSVPWKDSLSDQESTWITQWIVFSSWTASGSRYRLVGIRHIVLLAVSSLVLAAWFRVALIRQRELSAPGPTRLNE